MTRILNKHEDTVVSKPFTKLQQQFQLQDFDLPWNRGPMSCIKFPVQIVRGVCYIGELPAELSIPKKKEYLRNTKTAAKGSRIANHAWSNNHVILKTHQLLTKTPSEPGKH